MVSTERTPSSEQILVVDDEMDAWELPSSSRSVPYCARVLTAATALEGLGKSPRAKALSHRQRHQHAAHDGSGMTTIFTLLYPTRILVPCLLCFICRPEAQYFHGREYGAP
jgi:hypothetical protein